MPDLLIALSQQNASSFKNLRTSFIFCCYSNENFWLAETIECHHLLIALFRNAFPPALKYNYHFINCAAVAVFAAAHVSLRIQLQKHSSSIRTKRANAVAVFESSPFRYNKVYVYMCIKEIILDLIIK